MEGIPRDARSFAEIYEDEMRVPGPFEAPMEEVLARGYIRGDAPQHIVAKRRAKNKAARKSRRANRG